MIEVKRRQTNSTTKTVFCDGNYEVAIYTTTSNYNNNNIKNLLQSQKHSQINFIKYNWCIKWMYINYFKQLDIHLNILLYILCAVYNMLNIMKYIHNTKHCIT